MFKFKWANWLMPSEWIVYFQESELFKFKWVNSLNLNERIVQFQVSNIP